MANLVNVTKTALVNSRRKGKWHGSIGTPSGLVRNYQVMDIRKTYGTPLSKDVPDLVTALSYKSYIDAPLLKYLDVKEEDIGRTCNIATWAQSYNELWRIMKAFKRLLDSPIIKDIKDVIFSYKDDIIEAVQEYYRRLAKHLTPEQWKRMIADKKDSSSPYNHKKWGDNTESELRIAKKQVDAHVRDRAENYPNYCDKDLVFDPADVLDALRYREQVISMQAKRNGVVTATHTSTRSRTANGVKDDSFEGYPMFNNPEVKKYCLEPIYAVLRKIAKADVGFFSEEGVQQYLDIASAEEVTYADLKSGESQFGYMLDFLPISIGVTDMDIHPLDRKGASGVTLTPKWNEIVSCAYVRHLDEAIGLSKPIKIGSDNLAFLQDISDQFEDGLYGALSLDERFLGWKGDRHWPLNLVRDSPAHNVSWNTGNVFEMTRTTVGELRIIQPIVTNGLLEPDSAVRLYSNSLFKDIYKKGYNHSEDLYDALESNPELKDNFYDMFEDVVKWVREKSDIISQWKVVPEDVDDLKIIFH